MRYIDENNDRKRKSFFINYLRDRKELKEI